MIPLASRQCVGNMGLTAGGKHFSSKDHDLSGFGADLAEWTSLKVAGRDGKIRFLVNDREAFTIHSELSPNDIVGVQFRFEGVGSVGRTRFNSPGNEFIL